MANLALMLTWVPASLVIAHRWRHCCSSKAKAAAQSSSPACDTGYHNHDNYHNHHESSAIAHHYNPAFTRTGNHLANTASTPPPIQQFNNNSPAIVPLDNNSPSIIPLDNTHSALAITHHSPPNSPPLSSNMQSLNHSPHSLHSSNSVSQSPPRSPHIPITIPSSLPPQQPPSSSNCSCNSFRRAKYSYKSFTTSFFDRFLPWLIVKPRVLWVILLFGIAVYASILVLYYPGLRLPDTADFQLFNRDHYFERYDLDHKYNFWFERNLRSDIVNRLPIRIVWGVKPVDNGDHLNPASESTLEYDPTFDMSASESQSWLLKFCRDLRKQSFYMSTLGPLLPNCFIETFKSWMEERRCADSTQNRYPCCEAMPFPYPRWVFDKCITEAVEVLYQTPRLYFVPGVAGPKFNKTSGKMMALVVEYDSTAIWSLSYERMHRFFTQVGIIFIKFN